MPRQSGRFGVISSSRTGVAIGRISVRSAPASSSAPFDSSSSSTMIPACSVPMASSSSARIMPSDSMPRSFALPSFVPPGMTAPGRATATVWPAATFGAPQTICAMWPPPTSTLQTLRRSASGWRPCSSTLPTTKCSSASTPWWCTASTFVPVIVRRSSTSRAARPGSQYRLSHSRGARMALSELLEEPKVVVVQGAHVGQAVLELGDALDAHPPREALDLLRVVAVVVDVGVDVRVDLARAEDLDPALAPAQPAARAVLHEARPVAVEARDVDLDARLRERKEVRAQAHVPTFAEDRVGEAQQRALEVGERDVLVDREALDLVELRRVRRVAVAPVRPARDHDVQRRRVGLHRADLHRRRVRAQHDVGRDVEGVGVVAARVRRIVVERVEVVVDEVDLGALDAREAEAEEHVLDLAPRLRDEVEAADRLGRLARERDVDAVLRQLRIELRCLELLGALLDELLERLARLVGGAADGAALLGRELCDAAQEVRQLGLAAEVADAQLLERLARAGPGDGLLGLGAQRSDTVQHAHDAPTLAVSRWTAGGGAGGGDASSPRPRVASYRATVAAIAALSDSLAIGMCATRSQAARMSPGRPARSAPIRSVAGSSNGPASGAPARAARPMRVPGSPPGSLTRATGTAKIAPIDARTALGENGSAQPGPSATLAALNASAARSTVPTLPGSRTPHSATHSGPVGAGASRRS